MTFGAALTSATITITATLYKLDAFAPLAALACLTIVVTKAGSFIKASIAVTELASGASANILPAIYFAACALYAAKGNRAITVIKTPTLFTNAVVTYFTGGTVSIAFTPNDYAAVVDAETAVTTVTVRPTFGYEDTLPLNTLLIEGALFQINTFEFLNAGAREVNQARRAVDVGIAGKILAMDCTEPSRNRHAVKFADCVAVVMEELRIARTVAHV